MVPAGSMDAATCRWLSGSRRTQSARTLAPQPESRVMMGLPTWASLEHRPSDATTVALLERSVVGRSRRDPRRDARHVARLEYERHGHERHAPGAVRLPERGVERRVDGVRCAAVRDEDARHTLPACA